MPVSASMFFSRAKKAVLRWLHKILCVAWSTWETRVEEGNRTRMMGSKVCRQWQNKSLARARTRLA